MNFRNSGWWWRTAKPGVVQSMVSQRVRHDLVSKQQQTFCKPDSWETMMFLSWQSKGMQVSLGLFSGTLSLILIPFFTHQANCKRWGWGTVQCLSPALSMKRGKIIGNYYFRNESPFPLQSFPCPDTWGFQDWLVCYIHSEYYKWVFFRTWKNETFRLLFLWTLSGKQDSP